MKLIIRIKDGKPFEHPIFEDNFKQAFPNIDIEKMPADFALFTRIPQPELGPYEVYEGCEYELKDGACRDKHIVRPMTSEEIAEKQERTKQAWNAGGWVSWIFNEETCSFFPPIPCPEDGKMYKWDESVKNWVEVTL